VAAAVVLYKNVVSSFYKQTKLHQNLQFCCFLVTLFCIAAVYTHMCAYCVCQADSRSSLIKVHFDQLSSCDFWCCLCSRIMRQPQGSTSNLCKHMQARHPQEYASIVQIMANDTLVKVEEDCNGTLLVKHSLICEYED